MKKIITSLLALIILASCSTSKKSEEMKVLVPKGAPALSVLTYASEHTDSVDFVDGAELLQAAFLNPVPQYQVIIAPTNLGLKLASDKKTKYKIAGVVTWGNLYFVGYQQDDLFQEGTKIAAFGESSVPGLLLELIQTEDNAEIIYYNSVVDAQAALLSGKVDAALLAEPLATATIAKSKENESIEDLELIGDVQLMVEEKLGSYGYPQAGIFVLDSFYAENEEKVDMFLQEIEKTLQEMNSEELSLMIDEIQPETIGVPNAPIVLKTWDRMNIRYKDAKESEDSLKEFLKLFNIEITEDIYLK